MNILKVVLVAIFSIFLFSAGSVYTKTKNDVFYHTVKKDSSAEVEVYKGEVVEKSKKSALKKKPTEPLTEIPGPHEVSMEAWVHIVKSMEKLAVDKTGMNLFL